MMACRQAAHLQLAEGKPMGSEGRKKGIYAALSSALFLGMVPIFGKIAINGGFSPFAVIAIRTSIAALLMVIVMFIKMRPFFYIYPVGWLAACWPGSSMASAPFSTIPRSAAWMQA
jgi:hypothetical protein